MLRISVNNGSDNAVQFQLEGKLVGPWIEELRRLTEQALTDKKTVSLDLEKLRFMDLEGATLLRNLLGKNVKHINCSPFISQQLQETNL